MFPSLLTHVPSTLSDLKTNLILSPAIKISIPLTYSQISFNVKSILINLVIQVYQSNFPWLS